MQFSSKDYAVIGLTALTGIIHLFIGIVTTISEFSLLNLLILLNGIGYLAFIVAIYFPGLLGGLTVDWEFILKDLLIAFTIVTIVAYFATWGSDGLSNPVGMATKVIELILVLLLLVNRGNERIKQV